MPDFRGRGRSTRVARIPESMRRKKTWIGFSAVGSETIGLNLDPGLPAIGAPVVAIASVTSLEASAAGLLEGTLMRIRGSIIVTKSDISGAVSDVVIAFGIGFVTDEAAAAGAVPNPATAAGADWDGWLFYRSNLAAPLDANAAVMDSKAMRKWDGGQSLVLIGGAATDAATPTGFTNTTLIVRALFLLP